MKNPIWVTSKLCLGVLMLALAQSRLVAQDTGGQEGVEVLTRGPIHEAYAETVDVNVQTAPVVPKAPPDPIPEMPPDQKPEGDKVEWISGYWAWDVDRKDYIWVSGFWRTAPPGRQWMAGHWQKTDAGWQWVSGFWNLADKAEVAYLPPPPAAIEERAVPAPGDGYFYTPGCWVYRDGRYLWRPGTWVAYNADYVWVPAHYVWTPGGYVFIEGYWDHALTRRGMLFAPVYVSPDAVVRVEFCYTPRHVVCNDFMIGCLFVRPCAHHYYFGDYYDAGYGDMGFVAFVDYRVGGRYPDPLYGFYVQYPPYRDWNRETCAVYRGRFRGEIARPPHSFADQERLHISLTVTLAEAGKHGFRMEHISREQVLAAHRVAEERRDRAEQRHKTEVELHARGPVKVGEAPRSVKIEAGVQHGQPGPGTVHTEPSRVGTYTTPGSQPSRTGTEPGSGSQPSHIVTVPPPGTQPGHTGGTTTSPGSQGKPAPGSGSKPSTTTPPKKDKDKDKDKKDRQ